MWRISKCNETKNYIAPQFNSQFTNFKNSTIQQTTRSIELNEKHKNWPKSRFKQKIIFPAHKLWIQKMFAHHRHNFIAFSVFRLYVPRKSQIERKTQPNVRFNDSTTKRKKNIFWKSVKSKTFPSNFFLHNFIVHAHYFV